VDLISLNGSTVSHADLSMDAFANSAQLLDYVNCTDEIQDVAFLRLLLSDGADSQLSRDVYWLTTQNDVMNWTNSSWSSTPVTGYADLNALFSMRNASVSLTKVEILEEDGSATIEVILENQSGFPAWFIRLLLVDADEKEVLPTFWSDNHVTLFPNETLKVNVSWNSSLSAEQLLVSGGICCTECKR
jgi:exo-1,4-beta-D-glucosaminidase